MRRPSSGARRTSGEPTLTVARRPSRWSSAATHAKIARIAEGTDSVAAQPERELPAPVFIASLFGFAKAAFLGFMGIIGILTWEDVTEPWGFGALALAILFLLASYALLRGKPFARMVLGALAVIGGVGALVYVFVGPTSAIGPALVTAAMDALVLWLLYGTRSAKEYFGS